MEIVEAKPERWGGAPDEEVAQIMARLSDLQTWCVLMARKDSGGIPASTLIQDTRCLIVERLYPRAMAAAQARKEALEPNDALAPPPAQE